MLPEERDLEAVAVGCIFIFFVGPQRRGRVTLAAPVGQREKIKGQMAAAGITPGDFLPIHRDTGLPERDDL